MNLKEVSITLSGSENPKEELDAIMDKVKALPLTFYDEKGNEIKTKAKLAEIGGDGTDIDIEPIPSIAVKEINIIVPDDSCVKFEKMTPGILRLVYDGNVFFVALKTKENQTN